MSGQDPKMQMPWIFTFAALVFLVVIAVIGFIAFLTGTLVTEYRNSDSVTYQPEPSRITTNMPSIEGNGPCAIIIPGGVVYVSSTSGEQVSIASGGWEGRWPARADGKCYLRDGLDARDGLYLPPGTRLEGEFEE